MIEPEEYKDYLKFNERQKHYIKYLTSKGEEILVGYSDKKFDKFYKIFGEELTEPNGMYIHILCGNGIEKFSLYYLNIEKCIECLEYEKYLKKIKREQKRLNKILIKVSQKEKRSRL